MRKIKFANNEYYHIFNRGVDKRDIFSQREDYYKFLRNLKEFNNSLAYIQRQRTRFSSKKLEQLSSFLQEQQKVVDIISYSLNPNHFHLIVKQLKDDGIPVFMHKIGTSHTNYFNKKYERSGALFEATYKAIHIESNEYLLWLAGYVNGNIEIHGTGDAEFYEWSSFQDFLMDRESDILGDKNIIMSQFANREKFKKFVKKVIKESRSRKDLEKYLLEPARPAGGELS